MRTVYAPFAPAVTDSFNNEVEFVVDSNLNSDRVLIDDNGNITNGQSVIDYMKSNPSKTFLVSFRIYDNRAKLGLSNVVKFDPNKSVYGSTGTIQGGLIG